MFKDFDIAGKLIESHLLFPEEFNPRGNKSTKFCN